MATHAWKVAVGGMALAVAMGVHDAASAADFSFLGTFSRDDEVQFFDFSVGSPSTITLRSYSYAGGTQADGNVVPAGGFDPILALFDSAGNLVDQYDDGPDPVPADPVTGEEYDTNLSLFVAAGNYSAAIMQFDNFFNGNPGDNVSQGFEQVGDPTFTSIFGCSNGQFCDFTGDNRTANWAFDILNVNEATPRPVPLPAAAWLFVSGAGAIGFLARRRKAL